MCLQNPYAYVSLLSNLCLLCYWQLCRIHAKRRVLSASGGMSMGWMSHVTGHLLPCRPSRLRPSWTSLNLFMSPLMSSASFSVADARNPSPTARYAHNSFLGLKTGSLSSMLRLCGSLRRSLRRSWERADSRFVLGVLGLPTGCCQSTHCVSCLTLSHRYALAMLTSLALTRLAR